MASQGLRIGFVPEHFSTPLYVLAAQSAQIVMPAKFPVT